EAIALLESFSPPHTATTALFQELTRALEAIEQQRAEAEQRKRSALQNALDRARQALAAAAFDEVLTALDEAARLEPEDKERAALRAKAVDGVEKARQAAELQRRVSAAVAAARAQAANGNEDAALSALRQFRPRHPDVTSAIDEIVLRRDERIEAE